MISDWPVGFHLTATRIMDFCMTALEVHLKNQNHLSTLSIAILVTSLGLGVSGVAQSQVLTLTNPSSGDAFHPYSRDAIRAAMPFESDVNRTSPDRQGDSPDAIRVNRSESTLVPPVLPAADADRLARQHFGDQWALIQHSVTPALSVAEGRARTGDCQAVIPPGPKPPINPALHPCASFPGNKVANQGLAFPLRAIGKLMIKDAEGSTYTATAQVIRGNYLGETLVLTAAHNVWDYKTKAVNPGLTFIPAERDGAAPFGQYEWHHAFLLTGYTNDNQGLTAFDLAVLSLRNNAIGQPAIRYTGALGMHWNPPFIQAVTAAGYSSNGEAGNRLLTVNNSQTFRWTVPKEKCPQFDTGGDDQILLMGADLTSGSSGGAWIQTYRPFRDTIGNYVVSLIHGSLQCDLNTEVPMIRVGPRLTTQNIGEICAVAGCSPSSVPAP